MGISYLGSFYSILITHGFVQNNVEILTQHGMDLYGLFVEHLV